MKILLDENLPKRLKQILNPHTVFTVFELGWQSKKNGDLLSLMEANELKVMLTFDKNLSFQQNISKFGVTLIVLHAKSNSFQNLFPLMSNVLQILDKPIFPGFTEVSSVAS